VIFIHFTLLYAFEASITIRHLNAILYSKAENVMSHY